MAFVGAPAGGRTRHWQRRCWEHTILDDADCAAHMDYVHSNPVRHGYVPTPADWPYSTLERVADRPQMPAGFFSL